jgi:hypothetical protein
MLILHQEVCLNQLPPAMLEEVVQIILMEKVNKIINKIYQKCKEI